MYLLDTDIIIYSLKGNPQVKRHLAKHVHDSLQISIITLMELFYGAYRSLEVESNLAKVRMIEHTLISIPVNKSVADTFGRLKAKLESIGNRLDDFDLIIAATALAENLTLVSNNERHFKRVPGLKIENWIK